MKYGTKKGNLAKMRTPCLVLGIYENGVLTDSARKIDGACNGSLKKILQRGDITGKPNQVMLLHDLPGIAATRVLLLGLGDPDTMDAARFIGIARSLGAQLNTLAARHALCCLLEVNCEGRNSNWKTLRLVEHIAAARYCYTDMKGVTTPATAGAKAKAEQKKTELEALDFFVPSKSEATQVAAAITAAKALVLGMNRAKDLANTPSNICTPTYLARHAQKLARKYPSVTTKVVSEEEMKRLGMGAFMSVTQGSDQPGKLIVITYKGGKAKTKPHVILGKGITFDSGGISLKPGAGMHEMIFDMCGAASVIGTITAIAEQRLPINVVGMVAAAENMPSGVASRPGDIVTTMSGQTVEILNTDAEGRLVLCDALTYASRFKPLTVIDIATLTGACVIALGNQASALYANDEELAADLIKAGEDTQDRVWRMPLWEEYQAQLNSAFADMANIGGREAGSITAACFLARYTKQYRWAHLDIAGTAYRGGGAKKGATGRPVTLLWEYMNQLCAKHDATH